VAMWTEHQLAEFLGFVASDRLYAMRRLDRAPRARTRGLGATVWVGGRARSG